MYVLDCDKCVPEKYLEALLSANLYTAPYKHTPLPFMVHMYRYTAQLRLVGVSVMPRLYVFDYTQLSACSTM